ncbi:hypothetical protein SGFS_049060 [Streptomyces graminofaciens]|uniref:Uncharacterized protein n=1 Tax=Streptomyces graminofaciens TaxID=68212 RepID=A0ABN5VJM6_9ACTN|nr:hypothetical protein SGFS_049060 [Streptomyces graminofaciens]
MAPSPVATTAPASAYEPRDPAIMMTALTLNMPMGSRAIRLPTVKARAPGWVKRRRYGPGGRRGARGCPAGPRRPRGPKSAATNVSAVTVSRGAVLPDGGMVEEALSGEECGMRQPSPLTSTHVQDLLRGD